MMICDKTELSERLRLLDSNEGLKGSSIMVIGVDSIRSVNARYGHARGNDILSMLGRCIEECSGEYFNSRIDSKDRFIIFLKGSGDPEEAKKLYYTIREHVEESCRRSSFYQRFTISAGIYILDGTISDFQEIQSRVDFALFKAKENGRNCSYVFNSSDFDRFARNAELLNELRAAVENGFGAFEVYYQPIVDVKTYKVTGAEALLRFRSDDRMVSPEDFIPVLEDSGLIVPVGLFVLREALKESRRIRRELPDFVIHVNISYVQFKRSYILGDVEKLLVETGADAEGIIFEITESGFLIDDDRLQSALRGFRRLGLKVALDDFGTGYSNFIYLKDSKIDIVKLDKAFVNGALNNEAEYMLLKKIIDIVHDMDLRICLEGVETMSEMTILSADDPDYVQGYVFGRPVPMKEFYEEFIVRKGATVLSAGNRNTVAADENMNRTGDRNPDPLKNRLRILKGHMESANVYYKLLGSVLPVLMIMIMILAASAATFSYNVVKSYSEKNAELILDTTEDHMSSFFSGAEDLGRMLADQASSVVGPGDTAEYEKLLSIAADSTPHIKGCGFEFEPYAVDSSALYMAPYALKENGKVRITYDYSDEGYDYLSQFYYCRTRNTDMQTVTLPYHDTLSDTVLMTIATPVHDAEGRFIGCSVVDVTSDAVKEYVDSRSADYADHGEFMLLGRYGRLIAGETDDLEFMNNDLRYATDSKRDAVRTMITGRSGSVMYSDKSGQYCLYYRTMEDLGWKLVYKEDISNLNRGIFTIIGVIIFIATIVLLLTVILIVRLADRFAEEEKKSIERRKLYDETQLRAMQSAFDLIAAIDLQNDDMLVAYKAYKSCDFDDVNESSFDRHRHDFAGHIHEDDMQVYLSLTDPVFINTTLDSRSFITCEFRMKVYDEYKWMELIISRAKERNGTVRDSRCIYMLRDINERKLHEELADIEKQMLIVQLQDANKVLFEHGISDPLTGVYNREGLEHYAESIISDAENEGRRLLFLLADVNRLKLINDTFGHLSGDKAIKMVGKVLTGFKRQHQICARIGGDEFVYIASLDEDTDIEHDILDGFKELLAAENAESDLEFEVTFSLGYFWGRPISASDMDDYIRIADSRMYNMKKSGRP